LNAPSLDHDSTKPTEVPEDDSSSSLLTVVIAAAVAAFVVLAVVFSDPQESTQLGQGSSAPVFDLPLIDGGQQSLADYRGKVVLLNFWATWCKPCQDEMPSMERLHVELRDQGFELVAISVDDELAPVLEFRDEHELSFPILLDADMAVANAYQTNRFPESLLIDGQGKIISRFVGPREWDDPLYVERIRELLPPSQGPSPQDGPSQGQTSRGIDQPLPGTGSSR
jgi:cytochrome c biogenesis protein CcmG/thiol:disulfide interchange protein DsbE